MIKFILENLLNTNNGATIIETQRLNEKWFTKRGFIREFKELNEILDGNIKDKEKLFIYIVSFEESKDFFFPQNKNGKCEVCEKKTKFLSITKGYKCTCSKACEMKKGKLTIEKSKTNLKGTHSISYIKENLMEELKDFIFEYLLGKFNRFETQRLKDRHFEMRGLTSEWLKFKNILTNEEERNKLLKLFCLTLETNENLQELSNKISEKVNIKDENGLTHHDRLNLKRLEKDENGLNTYERIHLKNLGKDENGLNFYDRMQLERLKKDENGLNFYERIQLERLKKDENGLNFYDRQFKKKYKDVSKTKEDFELYSWLCRRITEKQPIHLLENFKLRGQANKGKYHLDHKFSISEGFKNNIPPHIIGNICNLEMIIGRNNLKKHTKCSIELNELNELNELFKKYIEVV